MMIVRSIQIIFAATLFLLDLLTALVLRRLGGRQRMCTFPERPRRRIENLGPTFIKLGQALSGRRDLLNESWTEILSSLQSQVHPFPAAVAVDIIEDSLGTDTKTLFTKFERTPRAAGSVAQFRRRNCMTGATLSSRSSGQSWATISGVPRSWTICAHHGSNGNWRACRGAARCSQPIGYTASPRHHDRTPSPARTLHSPAMVNSIAQQGGSLWHWPRWAATLSGHC